MSCSPKHIARPSRSLLCLGAAGLFASAAPQLAHAAQVSEAYISMHNLTTLEKRDPQSVSARLETANGVITDGTASFSGGMDITMTSVLGRGVLAQTYLDDYLTFHIPGGGSTVVNVTIAGEWYGTYNFSVNADFRVEYRLYLGSKFYNGQAYGNEFYNDGNPGSLAFTANRSPGSAVGTYSFTTPWTVYDNQEIGLLASLLAQCNDGGTAFINDPLTIALPAGVTFTAVSGATYAIPEPTTMFLLGAGLAATTLYRRRPLRA
jgi:hypothetical protein